MPPADAPRYARGSRRFDEASALRSTYRSLEGTLGAAYRVARARALAVDVVSIGPRAWRLSLVEDGRLIAPGDVLVARVVAAAPVSES